MRVLAIFALAAGSIWAADYKAGVGRVDITPDGPIWMSGYANRNKPSEGVLCPLSAKALALEDSKGGRAVIVTTDLIGLPRAITDEVAARVLKQYGLERARLLFNSVHTHTGPVVWPNLSTMFDLDAEQSRRVREYSRQLTDKLVTVIGAALGDLQPAKLAYGHGSADFAVNRRQFTPKGVAIGVNREGPVDHDVPVLRVTSPSGKLRAILFGYACHNTTLTAQFYQLSGDYAGFAQAALETAHPGTTAMFMELCGADQNPNPRSKLELAKQYGQTLATEVDRVLAGKLEPVRPQVRTAFKLVELSFAPHSREDFEKQAGDKNPARARRAQEMLKAYDEGHPVRHIPYPVQAIQFGKDLTLVALGGEVVIDYDLRVKKEFGARNIIVAGYSNDVMSYIPSARVLKEGGYEASDSMVFYGQPGPFNAQVEEDVFAGIRDVMKRVGRSPVKQ